MVLEIAVVFSGLYFQFGTGTTWLNFIPVGRVAIFLDDCTCVCGGYVTVHVRVDVT